MFFLKPVLALTAMLWAVLLAGLPPDATFGAQVDCRGVTLLAGNEEITLARVITTEARVNFIADLRIAPDGSVQQVRLRQ